MSTTKRRKKKVETPKQKKIRFSKLIVLFVISLNIIFTSVILFLFYKTGSEPSVLIGSFFAFTTGELLSLASIKNKENESGGN